LRRLLAKSAIAASQVLLADRGEWALNEKGIVEHAGLGAASAILERLTRPSLEVVEVVLLAVDGPDRLGDHDDESRVSRGGRIAAAEQPEHVRRVNGAGA
jgi:hypothetical protein